SVNLSNIYYFKLAVRIVAGAKNGSCFLQIFGNIDANTNEISFDHFDLHSVFKVANALDFFRNFQRYHRQPRKIEKRSFSESINADMSEIFYVRMNLARKRNHRTAEIECKPFMISDYLHMVRIFYIRDAVDLYF